MITLNAFTNGFANCASSLGAKYARQVRWVYFRDVFDGPTLFEDGHMFEADPRRVDAPLHLGWLVEPRALRPENYERAWNARAYFDGIFTYDRALRAADPETFRFCPRGGVHVSRLHWGLPPKTARIAMLTTHKRATPGQQLRAEIAGTFAGRVDVFGGNGWADKAQVLAPYRFVIVVEAERAPDLFTEHLLDAVALGCVPVYWGAPNIGEYFDPAGVLPFDSTDALDALLDVLERHGAEIYAARMPALQENLRRLDEYEFAEDWLVAHEPDLFAGFEEKT